MKTLNLSVDFPDETLYYDCVLPLRKERKLSLVLRTLLELYHTNPTVYSLVTGTHQAEREEDFNALNDLFDELESELSETEFLSASHQQTLSGYKDDLDNGTGGEGLEEEEGGAEEEQSNATEERLDRMEAMLSQVLEALQAGTMVFPGVEEKSPVPAKAEETVLEIEAAAPFGDGPGIGSEDEESDSEIEEDQEITVSEEDKSAALNILANLKGSLS